MLIVLFEFIECTLQDPLSDHIIRAHESTFTATKGQRSRQIKQIHTG